MGKIPLPSREEITKSKKRMLDKIEFEFNRKIKYQNGYRSRSAFDKECDKIINEFRIFLGWVRNYPLSERGFIESEIDSIYDRINRKKIVLCTSYGL